MLITQTRSSVNQKVYYHEHAVTTYLKSLISAVKKNAAIFTVSRFTLSTLALATVTSLMPAYANQPDAELKQHQAITQQCTTHYQSIDPATLSLVTNKLLFLEGPTWSAAQQLFYFSEMNFSGDQQNGPDSTIYQYSLTNAPKVLLQHSGSNGLLAVDDKLYVMKHSDRSVSLLDLATKSSNVLVNQYQGKKLNSPNDVIKHSNGGIYFTDPDWQLSERVNELNNTAVYWLPPQGDVVQIDVLNKPNGIVLSPDEKVLYVGDYSNKVYRYAVNSDGSIGTRQPFIDVDVPDGITVDCTGNVYIASHNQGNIEIYSPAGLKLQTVSVAPKITNMDFGGNDMKTLLITTGNGLFTLQTHMAGVIQK